MCPIHPIGSIGKVTHHFVSLAKEPFPEREQGETPRKTEQTANVDHQVSIDASVKDGVRKNMKVKQPPTADIDCRMGVLINGIRCPVYPEGKTDHDCQIQFQVTRYLANEIANIVEATTESVANEVISQLMKAHIHFHQGDFEAAQELVSGLTIPLILPNSKAFEILERIYREVNDRAPGDLESSLKLALLYQSVGRFVEAERVLRQAGTRPGLIPYLCEVLMLRGIVERRMDPVREAVKKMAELSSSQEKQVYQDLATQLDRFLLTYRFLAK